MTAPAGVFPTGTPNLSATGTLASVNNAVALATDTFGSVDFAISGTPVGAIVYFESTSDGTNWVATKAYQKGGTGAAGSTTASAAGVYNVTVGGAQQVRARLNAVTSGSFSVTANGTASAAHVGVKNGNAADLQATITPAGATLIDRSSVVNSAVTAAAVVAGGSGGANGLQTVTGTTGTGVKFQASVTVSGGAITSVLSITVAGSYSTLPTNPAVEPVSGAGLTGATLNLTMATIATQLAAANSSRKGWRLQNTSNADQWFNDTGGTASIAGAGSFKISSGGYYETPVGGASQASISIYGATPSQTFSASEW